MAVDPWSVNSPRIILSLSKKRSKSPSSPELDYNFSRVAFSGEHGPIATEVYGFLVSISTVVVAVIFFLWAYLPDRFLRSIGISYYPSRMMVLKNGIEVKLQRNVLSVMEPPTGNEEDDDEFDRLAIPAGSFTVRLGVTHSNLASAFNCRVVAVKYPCEIPTHPNSTPLLTPINVAFSQIEVSSLQ